MAGEGRHRGCGGVVGCGASGISNMDALVWLVKEGTQDVVLLLGVEPVVYPTWMHWYGW